MRSRPLVALVAASALALTAASCGGDDEQGGSAPVPTTQPTTSGDGPGSPTAPATTPGADAPDATDAPDAPSGKDDGPASSKPPTRGTDADLIPAVASKNADLTNFTTALGAAGLTATLEETGPFTIFAPNNDGFAKLGTRLDALLQPAAKAELVNILSFHVVQGDVRMKDLKDGTLLTTVQGTRLRVTRSRSEILIGNSLVKGKIVSSDIDAGNGVVHAIDSVLTPKPAS